VFFRDFSRLRRSTTRSSRLRRSTTHSSRLRRSTTRSSRLRRSTTRSSRLQRSDSFFASSALDDSLFATLALDDSLFAASTLDDSLFATSALEDPLFTTSALDDSFVATLALDDFIEPAAFSLAAPVVWVLFGQACGLRSLYSPSAPALFFSTTGSGFVLWFLSDLLPAYDFSPWGAVVITSVYARVSVLSGSLFLLFLIITDVFLFPPGEREFQFPQ
jgi:hypothetical protein